MKRFEWTSYGRANVRQSTYFDLREGKRRIARVIFQHDEPKFNDRQWPIFIFLTEETPQDKVHP